MSAPLRILFHNCRLLHPLHGGDRIRTYNMVRELRQQHRITYLCLRTPADHPDAEERAAEYCDELIAIDHPVTNERSLRFYAQVLGNTLFGKYPFLGQKYLSRGATRRICELASGSEGSAHDLLICDYLAPMVNLLELGSRPSIPTLLFQHNVESLIFERHAKTARNPIKSILYRQQWRMLRAFERQSADFMDAQVTVSDNDTRILRDEFGMTNVLGAVPTGVDCAYFAPEPAVEQKPVLAFLGAMDWEANQEAVFWFVDEIMPRIWARVPATEFLVIGRNPPARLRSLAAADPRIRVTGTVPDVRPFMREATAMVLPLRVGGGTRIKIYEAMAIGVPVLSTAIGAEGLDVEHERNILLADSAEAFTASAIRLLTESKLGNELGEVARAHVAQNYSWSRVAEIFSGFCAETIQRAQPRLAKLRA